MYLNKLSISRFRSCKETEIILLRELTILVGENNGGKSNILDAIRLATKPLNGRRDRYAEDADIRRGTTPINFEIKTEYHDLSTTLKGLLNIAVTDPTKDIALFGCRYEPPKNNAIRGNFISWAGKFDTAEPEAGSTDLIRHVYLPALRDAHQALGASGSTRIMSLFRHFLPKEEEQVFLKDVRRQAGTPTVLVKMNTDIGLALKELTSGVRCQSAEVNFASENVQDVARDLRFKMGDAGFGLEEIRTSGLGYSNLLYIATVVVELTKAQEADLTLFLVEEPEAHLHPQLQMLVLEFLLTKAQESFEREPIQGQPEGKIQVVVSTHSPNLTAGIHPKHIVVVRSQKQEGESEPSTCCVPISTFGMSDKVLNKISRYLDVTRSSLLFGSRVTLVEGIAESLLLPVLARKIILHGKKEAWLRFKGTVIVPIDGVDFSPYVETLLRPYKESRIADSVVVITDTDPAVAGNRKVDLETLATSFNAATKLHVFTNEVTLEHELFKAGNAEILKSVFLEICPRSAEKWKLWVTDKPASEQALSFINLLEDSRVRKGDFAQTLATSIEASGSFKVPEYLRLAILKISDE